MIRQLIFLASIIPLASFASNAPVAFKIQCEQFGGPIVFAYEKSKYPDTFLIGVTGRLKSLGDMAAFDLQSIERIKQKYYEAIAVYYTSNELNHYGEDKKVLHKLTYYQDNSISIEAATLNKNGTKLLSSHVSSASSDFAPISKCVSVGIW